MQKKLQVFVSSTYEDMQAERQAVAEAILLAGHIPAGMELFPSGDKSVWDTIRRWIDSSDVFVLIVGGRYGAIEPESGKSYIQLEYEYAKRKKKPRFALMMDKSLLDKKIGKLKSKATDAHGKALEQFKALVLGKMCSTFDCIPDLKLKIVQSIREIESDEQLGGWIRSDSSDWKVLIKDAERFKKDNDTLRSRLNELHNNSVHAINDGFVKSEVPGPVVTAVFGSKGRAEQLQIQKKIVMLLHQLNYLSMSWVDRHEYGVLSEENWEQRLTWYKNTVWKDWIKNDPELFAVNAHLMAVDDFQNKQFGMLYKRLMEKWKNEDEGEAGAAVLA